MKIKLALFPITLLFLALSLSPLLAASSKARFAPISSSQVKAEKKEECHVRVKKAKRWAFFKKASVKKKGQNIRRHGFLQRISLGFAGLLVMILGGMFIALGLAIPGLGILFLVIGIIIASVGLMLWVLLNPIGVRVSSEGGRRRQQ